ncbi:hypothetical protein L486_07915 [Kwoniella mangroviensis CBS 10435]|uniref:DUF3669 domain-containing protein n=1 Tax=Kwoniella mangroviensis CBS 10435 TaxID=1331196 RepID=A0A1B9IGH0_9TREE|nr:hypothetical protein L486_07915 [Kwoniella mangroviensis CBS 10435]
MSITPKAVPDTYLQPDKPRSSLQYITEGTFGRIYRYANSSDKVVYKMVKEREHGLKLQEEFSIYGDIHQSLRPIQVGFRVPKPIEYYKSSYLNEPSILLDRSSSPIQSAVTKTFNLPDDFEFPAFSMSLIPPLDTSIVDTYKSLFWSEDLQNQNRNSNGPNTEIRLLRLYFGREDIPLRTEQIQPGIKTDPPLDIFRYNSLSCTLKKEYDWSLPYIEDVSSSMGRLLANLHWLGGTNCRDIELVLGGGGNDGRGEKAQCWVLDFNQCQRWLILHLLQSSTSTSSASNLPSPTTGIYSSNTLLEASKRLSTLIYTQELYYPRPHQGEVYEQFKKGYERAVELILNQQYKGKRLKSKSEIREATKGFFEEYEKLDREKMARRSRMGKQIV